MVIRPEFWRGKRVFLTGHTGFKGSWLSLWLQSLGAEVSGWALAPATQPSLFELARVATGMRSTLGDVREAPALQRALAESRADIVLHLAAQSLVRHSYSEPLETYATNVMGTAHLLEAIRRCETVRAAIVVTSDKCYENREWPWGYREVDPMGGRDPYSSSKGCAELATAAWRASYFGPGGHGAAVASARAGNVIGGGDWAADRLVPDLVRAAVASRPVEIRNPDAVRPWQHVLEPLAGYLMLAEKLFDEGRKFAEGWNFGPRDEDCRTVSWVVTRLASKWGDALSWQVASGERPHEAQHLKLDSSKAIARLGWAPRWDLAGALDAVVHWHKQHLAGADMRQVMLEQIAGYTASNETAAR